MAEKQILAVRFNFSYMDMLRLGQKGSVMDKKKTGHCCGPAACFATVFNLSIVYYGRIMLGGVNI